MPIERVLMPHVLQRLILEPSCDSAAIAQRLWPRLSLLCTGPLEVALSEVLSAHAPPADALRIHRLVLDVGPVRESHLEEDLIAAICRSLHGALARLSASISRSDGERSAGASFPGPSLGDGEAPPERLEQAERIPEEERQRERLRSLLLTGTLPWWCSEGEPRDLETLFQRIARTAPDVARRVILSTGRHAMVRRRLVLQLGEPALREVIWLIEHGHAPFIIAYLEELEREQAEGRFLPTTPTEFRRARWELVLGYLVEERGSRFNTKMFVRSTIEGMSQRYGVGYETLLAHLRSALPEARFARSAPVLRTLLEELWQECAEPRRVQRTGPDSAANPERLGEESHGEGVRATAQEPGDSGPLEEEAHLDARLAFIDSMLSESLSEGRRGPLGHSFEETFLWVARRSARLRWVLLGHWHRPQLRARLAERPEPLLEELVRVVLPAHAIEVIGYSRHLRRAHERRPIMRGDAQSFRRARWRFLLECLVLQQGSTFNTRVFIRTTLERLGAHHNLDYARLLEWVWRELAPLPSSRTSTHPLVSHLGALYLELRSEQRRRAAASGGIVPGDILPGDSQDAQAWKDGVRAWLERVSTLPPARASALLRSLARSRGAVQWLEREGSSDLLRQLLRSLLAPAGRTLALTALSLVERLGLGAGGLAALPSEASRRLVRGAALGLLVEDARARVTPKAFLEALLRKVASSAGLGWDEALALALRRQRRLGSSLAVVQSWVEELARGRGISRQTERRPPAEEAARAFEQLVLSGPSGRAGSGTGEGVSVLLDRVERETPRAVQRRLALLLRDPVTRRRALRTAGDAIVIRALRWRYPERVAVVTSVLQTLRPVLDSSQLSETSRRSLRDAFWRYIWNDWTGSIRGRGPLLQLFLAELARREPRVLAAISSLPGGTEQLGLLRPTPVKPRPSPRAPEHPAARERRASSPRWGEEPATSFQTRTAGSVLLWPYLSPYFKRLGLLSDAQEFRGVEAQERAVGLVQFLATGLVVFQEPDLTLSKVLCGLAPEWPVPLRLELDEATRELSEGLLKDVVKRWKAVGSMSVGGLRGSFLCREGRLTASEERWTLDVETKTFDILLDSCPWQLSTLKLRWMPRVIFVNWRK